MKGYAAYAKVKPTKEGYRDLEYKILGTVTGALIKANEQGTELSDKFHAVLWNEKVCFELIEGFYYYKEN